MFSFSGVRVYAIELTISALEALLGGKRNMCTVLVIPLWSTMTQVLQFMLAVALLFTLLAGGLLHCRYFFKAVKYCCLCFETGSPDWNLQE